MGWLINMIWLWIFGLIPVICSIVFGLYWLKYERFPWERDSHLNEELAKKEDLGR